LEWGALQLRTKQKFLNDFRNVRTPLRTHIGAAVTGPAGKSDAQYAETY